MDGNADVPPEGCFVDYVTPFQQCITEKLCLLRTLNVLEEEGLSPYEGEESLIRIIWTVNDLDVLHAVDNQLDRIMRNHNVKDLILGLIPNHQFPGFNGSTHLLSIIECLIQRHEEELQALFAQGDALL